MNGQQRHYLKARLFLTALSKLYESHFYENQKFIKHSQNFRYWEFFAKARESGL
jgi:hypothetical protein